MAFACFLTVGHSALHAYAICTITAVSQVTCVVIQVAFVDPPELDFDLTLPSNSHGSGLLDYVEGWADAFITDSILSQYVLPDHYFSQIDSVGPFITAVHIFPL